MWTQVKEAAVVRDATRFVVSLLFQNVTRGDDLSSYFLIFTCMRIIVDVIR